MGSEGVVVTGGGGVSVRYTGVLVAENGVPVLSTHSGVAVTNPGTGVSAYTGVVVPRKTVTVGRGVAVCAAQ
jgi:hypothetical protein